jgi:cytochrome b561
MMRNSPDSWGSLSKSLHWIIAGLIAVEVPLGFWMTRTFLVVANTGEQQDLLTRLEIIHQSIGFIVLILVTIRLAWRMSNPAPGLPVSLQRYQKFVARTTHAFLYLLLFAFPISGWAALSTLIGVEGWDPDIHFLWFEMPGLVPPEQDGDFSEYGIYATIHRLCWQIGTGVLAMHLVAAVWHHVIRRDDLVARMLPNKLAGRIMGVSGNQQ